MTAWNRATARRSALVLALALPLALGVLALPRAAAAADARSQALFGASFKDFERQLQPLAQFQGKPMLLVFWATWCKSCKHEVPELIGLQRKYGDKLAVVGISVDNTDKVRAFAKEYGINYTLLLGSNDAMALSRQLGNSVGGLPFAVMVDAKGEIVHTLLGETAPGKFEELVRPLVP